MLTFSERTGGELCPLLMIFAISLDPDQVRQNRTRSGSKLFDTLVLFLKEFFEKKIIKKWPVVDNKSMKKYHAALKAKNLQFRLIVSCGIPIYSGAFGALRMSVSQSMSHTCSDFLHYYSITVIIIKTNSSWIILIYVPAEESTAQKNLENSNFDFSFRHTL